MNREQYIASQTSREYHLLGLRGIPYTRDEYLAEQLERINSEVPICPNADTTPDLNSWKGALFGLKSVCTACGFTVEGLS